MYYCHTIAKIIALNIEMRFIMAKGAKGQMGGVGPLGYPGHNGPQASRTEERVCQE
jgi:hypothetical protein